jgi:DNA replication ATP-dependent helicase Dna2
MQQLAGARGWKGLEILTMDKYQGRDKEAMLLSMVRSNSGRQAGALLADWRRINVAITRAKSKLVLVGSASTISSVPLLARLLAILQRRNCVLSLPASMDSYPHQL